ncbi:MAG TPA: YdeI/OmpD-associated family protein [Mycobacteriales bacterium]|nr:YdeI/OmpD-associated family protein [Mycobacteriales bacterium]
MTATTFKTTLVGFGNNTGIEVPAAQLELLGAGKRPAVIVTVNDYTYRSTPGTMNGRTMLPFAKVHREASGLKAGDAITVTLTLEEGPRPVDVPAALTAALKQAGLMTAFDALSYTKRKEFARGVADAKGEDTRDRRIAKVLDALR